MLYHVINNTTRSPTIAHVRLAIVTVDGSASRRAINRYSRVPTAVNRMSDEDREKVGIRADRIHSRSGKEDANVQLNGEGASRGFRCE